MFKQDFKLLLRTSPGHYFYRFWDDLVPKSSILRGPWRAVVPKIAPQIGQVAPKWLSKSSLGTVWVWSGDPSSPKVAFGALLGTILVDFGSLFAPKSKISERFVVTYC